LIEQQPTTQHNERLYEDSLPQLIHPSLFALRKRQRSVAKAREQQTLNYVLRSQHGKAFSGGCK
jgi:hypothetical protein